MEYEQLKRTGTFKWVENLPDGQKAVCNKIILKDKHDGDGNIVKLKAQIVVKGFDQVPGQDYELTFASIAKFTTLQVALSCQLLPMRTGNSTKWTLWELTYKGISKKKFTWKCQKE